jgi:hypothetical protein
MGFAPGFTVILATEPTRSAEFFRELCGVVGESRGAVLIVLQRPARWSGGPVLGVHLRRHGAPAGELGPGLWLGPLREDADRRALRQWLRAGGPVAGPPPARLRCRALTSPAHPLMAAQTLN